MSVTWSDIIYLLAGVLTGIINTVAGSGTVVSLGSMIWQGVPVNLANTTNRLGVFFQNVTAIRTYVVFNDQKTKQRPLFMIIPTLLGALTGGLIAIEISNQAIAFIASLVMVLMLGILVFRVKDRIRKVNRHSASSRLWVFLIFFAAGVYGGLIQIGIGIILLVAIMLFSEYDYYQANMVKLIIILIYTIPTVILFIVTDMMVWRAALTLSLGQIAGAYLGGRASIHWVNMNKWINPILISIILATLVRLWFF